MTRAFGDVITFSHTGLAPVRKKKNTLKNQLQNFHFSLLRAGAVVETEPRSWLEAFFLLQQFLDRAVHPTLVRPLGIKTNEYSDVFQSVIVLDDLFD